MQSTQPKKRTYIMIIAAVVVVILAALTFLYCVIARNHADRFPEKTYLNGMDISGMSAARAKRELANFAEEYTLTITERDGVTETITSEQIGLTYVDNGDVDALLEEYNPYRWIFDRFRTDELTASADTVIDEAAMESAINGLTCFSRYTPVQDAFLDFNGSEYYVVEEVYGNELDPQAAADAIRAALVAGETSINLEELGLYLTPEVLSDDAALNSRKDTLNGYLVANITFDFGDDRIVTVDASVIRDWLVEDEEGNIDLSYDAAYEFVKTKIAYKIDTFGLTHHVTTHSGIEVTLSGGDYGWCVARGDTTDKILDAVREGYVGELEAEFQYSGKNMGKDDIGGTYIEISISEQMMWCYKDYECIVETPVVTGNVNKGNGTPYGSVWAINGMKKDAVLGTMDTMGYESPVNYWMPFTGNVGIHDADGWRSAYGGTIYLTNGSHGCVNTPLEAAETIFNTVERGTAVVVYNLEDMNNDGIKDSEQASTEFETPQNDDDWDWDD